MREAKDAQPGDKVMPDPVWNASERWHRQLHLPTEVWARAEAQNCGTGVLLQVRTKGGHLLWLSAGWFTHIVE